MRPRLRSRIGSTALAVLLLAAVVVSPPPLDTPTASAATFVVTKPADSNDGVCDADCSLREAIIAADAAPGPDQVTLQAGTTYLLTLGAIPLSNGGDVTTVSGGGAGLTIIDAAGGSRVFVGNGGAHRIEGVTITGGFSSGAGNPGGAIINFGTTNLTLYETEVTDNVTDGAGTHGGAIYNIGTLNIERSTISDNFAFDQGGAIYSAAGTVTVYNSTISGNSSGGTGAAIYHQNGGLTIESSTITDNNTGFIGGVVTTGSVTIGNSILAANGGGDCWVPISGGVPLGTIASNGFNIVGVVGDGFCVITPATQDQFGSPGAPTDPRLGPLDDFGFPTRVHLPFLDSPAVDQGNSALIIDQTGVTRPDDIAGVDNAPGGNGSDIGAVEGTATLQQTIDWATPGDLIKVWPGTYNENLWINKDITLQGADDGNKPVIVNNSETATIEVGAGATTVNLVDLAVTNGADGGVRNSGTALFIDGLDIYGNDGPSGGGGVNHPGPIGTTTITDSHIYFNTASQGAGVYAGPDGNVTITNTEIGPNNVAQGVGGGVANASFGTAGIVTINGGSIHDNYATNGGGGAYLNTFSGSLTNVSVIDNVAGDGGGINVSGGFVTVAGGQVADNQSGVPSSTPSIDNFTGAATGWSCGFGNAAQTGFAQVDTGSQYQGFVATSDEVASIKLRLARSGWQVTPENRDLHINIREGGPDGPIVAQAVGYPAVGAPPFVDLDAEFILRPALDVTPGSLYVIELYRWGGFSWYGTASGQVGAYAPAQSWGDCGGGISASPDRDFEFRVFAPNSAGLGGGISNSGGLELDGVIVDGNKTVGSGGGLFNEAFDVVTVLGGSFANNAAEIYGGAIYNGEYSPLEIGAFGIAAAGGEFEGEFEGDVCEFPSGGAYDAPVIHGNTALDGGGVYTSDYGITCIGGAALWGNEASGDGGGVYNNYGYTYLDSAMVGPDNLAQNWGGGIYNRDNYFDVSDIQLTNSAVVFNSADEGGGIYNEGSSDLTNVTISGNEAAGDGGGYVEVTFETTYFDSVTITDNVAGVDGFQGGGGFLSSGYVYARNSLIAGNFAEFDDEISVGVDPNDCAGFGVTSLGNNLVGANDCSLTDGFLGDQIGSQFDPIDPVLGPLETAVVDFNGGAVDLSTPYSETYPLEAGDYAFRFTVQPTAEVEDVTVQLGSLYVNTISTAAEGDSVSVSVPIEVETSGNVTLDITDDNGVGSSPAVSDLLLIRLDGRASVHPLLAGSPAIDAGAPLDTVSFPTFTATPAPLTLNGGANGASIVNDGSQDVLRTNAPAFVAGSAFLTDPIPVDESWSTEFDFRIVPQTLFAGESGDGIAFAVAPGNTFLGDPAGRLGIGVTSNTSTVTAVGFKTYGTPGNVGIYVNPTSDSSSVFPTFSTTPGDLLDDGQVRTVWIDYDALSTTLEVRMADVGSPRPSTALLSYPVDIAASLGTTNAYLGFTGSSGAATALQDVLRWELATSLDCSGEDQRGIDREPYGPCDIGAYELEAGALNPSVSLLDFSSDNPTPSPGASSISVADIPRDVIVGASGPGASSTPISDIESASVDSVALNSTALNSVALNSTALNSTALNSTELDDNALDAVLLSDVPITGGWDDILAVSVPPVDPALAGLPIQTVTLLDALSDPAISAELAARGITIADLDLGDTPLGSLPFSAIAMGTISIKDIGSGDFPRGSGGDPSGVGDAQVNNLVAWCDELTQAVCAQLGVTFDGGGLPIPTSADGISLMTLVLAGSPVNSAALNSTALNSVALNSTALNSTPISAAALNSTALNSTALNSVALNSTALNSVALNSTALNSTALNSTALNSVALNSVALNSTALNSVALNSTALNSTALNSTALNSVALNSVALNSTALNSVALNSTALNSTALNSTALNSVALNSTALNSTALNSTALNSVALNSTALNSTALNSTALNSVALNSVALNSTALNSVALNSVALNSTALNSVALNSVPIGDLGSLVDCGSVDCSSPTLTLGDLTAADILPGATYSQLLQAVIDSGQLSTLTYAEILGELADLNVLGGISYADVLGDLADQDLLGFTNYAEVLGDLADLDLLGFTNYALILTELVAEGFLATTSYAEILGELADQDLLDFTSYAQVLTELVALNALPALTYADILGELADLDLLDFTNYAEILTDMVDQGVLGTESLADIYAQLLGPPNLLEDLGLGDLFDGLIATQDLSWQELDLGLADLQALDAGGGSVVYTTEFEIVDGSGGENVDVTVNLPEGFILDASDPATLTTPTLGTPATVEPDSVTDTGSGLQVVFNLTGVPDGISSLSVPTLASVEIGPTSATASVAAVGDIVGGTEDLNIQEALEPNDTFAEADGVPAQSNTLYLTHLSSADDRDLFKLEGLPVGAEITGVLGNLPKDYDLVLYAPAPTLLRKGANRSASAVDDDGLDILNVDETSAENVGDVDLLDLDGEGLVVHTISAHRGTRNERIDTGPIRVAGDYYFQVTGYNGASDRDPYSFRMKVVLPGDIPVCAAPGLGSGTPGTSGPVPADVNTLFLVNRQRLEAAYGASAANAVMTAIGNVAAANELGVSGAVVAVDDPSYVPIVSAYNGLESNPCSVDAANGVASAIADLVDNLRTNNPTIQNVVIVGGDEQIPHFRVPDEVYLSNENTYASTFGDLDDPISRAFDASNLFTDDPYGDPTPVDANGREVYVTEVALGRLVERPGEIVLALDNFITYNGLLDPASTSSAFVTGYDFLTDGAAAVADQLDDTVPPRPVSLLNNDTWDRDILLPAWLNGLHSIMSINAHFDHNRAQPAATDTGTSTLGEGLVTVEDVIASGPDTLTRGVIFSMGCHAGLSVSDVQISGGPVDPLVGPAADALERDWAQTFAEQGAVLAANTGYGYGDTEAVALSELLMTYFADNLDGSMSVGEALQYAKHRYASGALLYGAFDDKVLMQAVFYGLPMYAIGANPTTAPPVDPLPLGFDGVTGLTVASFDVDLAIGSDLVETTTPRGSFFSVEGVTQVTPLRPIQPKVEIDATQPGDLIAHGALITALDSFDQEPFDPVVSKATVDLAANEPEPGVIGSFPSALQAVNRYQTKAGLRDQLVLVPGQFRNTTETEGVQRLFTNLEGFVFYSPLDETDFKAPTITRVEGTGGTGGITFDVEVADADSGVGRVYVLFKDPADFRWVGLDLAPNGLGNWSGTAVGASGLKDYFVQAVDLAGNVAVSSNKAELFITGNVPPPSPLVAVTGTQTAGNWYVGSATVELDLLPGVTAVYDVDASGTLTEYSEPFTVSGDGPVDFVVQTSGGAFETVTLFIDDAPPVVVSPLDGATFVKDEVVDYLFECIDASSGVVTCSGPVGQIDTSVAGTFSFSVTAIDEAGNQTPAAAATIEYTVLPDPPTVTAVAGNPGTVDEGTPVAFTASVADATTPQYQWQVLFNGGEVLTSTTPTLDFTALDDGAYEVRVRVRDAASGLISEPVSESFTANNVAPTIGLAGDATVDVGALYTLTLGTVIDPGADNVGVIGVDWGDGTQDEYNGIGDVTHIYTTLGSRTITVDLIDDDGVWLAAATLDVEATEPPSITDLTVTPDLLSVADGLVDLEATFTGSVLTATIDWGDGTVEPATVAGTITGSHTYVTPEVHQVTLTLENSVGEIAVESYFVVVYDPLGASVKGNGEIALLPGTYFADPSITGENPKPDDDPEAKFGINAKYNKDGDLDGDGKSKLKFKVLDLDIKSLTYDWLVITGGLARYEGKLEFKDFENVEYGFRVTAIDGDLDDNDTYLEDEYGIVIWDSGGTVVFDTTDAGSATRPLAKGKIKIKPPKDNPL